MNSIHELLPWYVNGTLDAEESAMFKDHLAACGACGSELVILEQMKAELERHGEDLLSDHPPAHHLVAAVTAEGESGGELTGGRKEEIRRHLALCATCGQEAAWVLHEAAAVAGVAAKPTIVPVTPGRRFLNFAMPLAAGFLLAALLLPLVLQDDGEGAGETGLLKPVYVPSGQRAGGEPVVIRGISPARTVSLIFPVDMESNAYPLRFEIVDSAGRAVYSVALNSPEELYQGAFLMVGCRRQDCPDGSYAARLTSLSVADLATEYPFRLDAATSGP